MNRDHVREHIELAIDRARDGVSERIDELDRRLRSQLDFKKMAGEHAVQIAGAGAVLGFLIGYGIPKVLLRSIQIGVPVFLAVKIMKDRYEEGEDSGSRM